MPLSVKAVAFPVTQRQWLLYAWRLGEADAPAVKGPGGVQGFVQTIPDRIVGTAEVQWVRLSAAKEGTFRNWLYKCASACALTLQSFAPVFDHTTNTCFDQQTQAPCDTHDRALISQHVVRSCFGKHEPGFGLSRCAVHTNGYARVQLLVVMCRSTYPHTKARSEAEAALSVREPSRKAGDCRLTKTVLSWEDPIEAFYKRLPAERHHAPISITIPVRIQLLLCFKRTPQQHVALCRGRCCALLFCACPQPYSWRHCAIAYRGSCRTRARRHTRGGRCVCCPCTEKRTISGGSASALQASSRCCPSPPPRCRTCQSTTSATASIRTTTREEARRQCGTRWLAVTQLRAHGCAQQ